jgi:hypothetical protein
MPLTSEPFPQPCSASTPLPAEIAQALRHVTLSQSARLASDLARAFDPASWPPPAARRIARALHVALQTLGDMPSRFIAAEDEVASALAAAEVAPEHVERVLADLEDIYITRWA